MLLPSDWNVQPLASWPLPAASSLSTLFTRQLYFCCLWMHTHQIHIISAAGLLQTIITITYLICHRLYMYYTQSGLLKTAHVTHSYSCIHLVLILGKQQPVRFRKCILLPFRNGDGASFLSFFFSSSEWNELFRLFKAVFPSICVPHIVFYMETSSEILTKRFITCSADDFISVVAQRS